MGRVEELLPRVLAQSPDLTAREIAWRMRSLGAAVTKRDINPILYRDARYRQDGGNVPRWRLAEQAATRPDLQTRIQDKRERRRRLDEQQEHVAALRSGRIAVDAAAAPDSALAAAIAFLRERGIEVPGLTDSTPSEAPPAAPRERARPTPDQRPSAAPRPTSSPAASGRPTHRRAPSASPIATPAWVIRSLRPWQQEALTAWYAEGCVGICEAVTGTGKTHLGLEAVAQCLREGRRATVLVPSILLQRQWELRLEEFVGAAVIAKVGGAPRGDAATADVVIAVVHSATKLDVSRLGTGMDLLVADEVHRYGGEGWAVALRAGYTRRLGLTATLERAGDDGVDEHLLPYFTNIVHSYGYDRATREDVVAPFDLVFLGVQLGPDEQTEYESLSRRLSQARKVLLRTGASPANLHQQLGALRGMGGEVTRAVMAFENATRERRRLLADTTAKHVALCELDEFVRESDGTVIFTQSIATAGAAAEVLRDRGISAESVSSEMNAARRQQLISDLGDGALQALAAPRILDEGVDVPDVNLGIVMGASSSRRQMIQRLGRVIRLKANGGRARFVVLYVVGTVEDPQTGARQDFMAEVEDAASRVVCLPDWDEDDLSAVWAGASPTWTYEPVLEDAPVTEASRQVPRETAVEAKPVVAAAAPPQVRATAPPRARRVRARTPQPRRPARPTAETLELLEEIEQTRELLALMRDEAGRSAS